MHCLHGKPSARQAVAPYDSFDADTGEVSGATPIPVLTLMPHGIDTADSSKFRWARLAAKTLWKRV